MNFQISVLKRKRFDKIDWLGVEDFDSLIFMFKALKKCGEVYIHKFTNSNYNK